jgi:hypothetical protein
MPRSPESASTGSPGMRRISEKTSSVMPRKVGTTRASRLRTKASLQSWIRNAALDPDWLRVGTDITHQGPFNAAFTLSGDTVAAVPEPETYALLLIGIAAIGGFARLRRKGR